MLPVPDELKPQLAKWAKDCVDSEKERQRQATLVSDYEKRFNNSKDPADQAMLEKAKADRDAAHNATMRIYEHVKGLGSNIERYFLNCCKKERGLRARERRFKNGF